MNDYLTTLSKPEMIVAILTLSLLVYQIFLLIGMAAQGVVVTAWPGVFGVIGLVILVVMA